ncbi:MAG: hypothetical protein LBK02_01775 [Treponema sp.]|nr:hypothetical protein [Treponema sp.]
MKRTLLMLLTALIFLGCKNILDDSIMGNRDRNGKKEIHEVTIDTPEHGSILAKPASGRAGTEITLVISPDLGYRLKGGSLKYRVKNKESAIDEKTRTFRLPSQDITVSALFDPLPPGSYSISVKIDNLEHGAVIARPEFGVQDTPIYLAIIPDPGYRYVPNSLKCDDTPVDSLSRIFKLPDTDVLITAQFEPLPPTGIYTVRTGVFPNGRIYAHPEFSPPGAAIYLQVSPDPGYILKEKSLKYQYSAGEKFINEQNRTFIMPGDHVTAGAKFIPVPGPEYYTVSAENIPGGRLILSPEYGKANEQIFLHVIPDPGYALAGGSLKIKGSGIDQQIDEDSRIFNMPAENVYAEAKFEKLSTGLYTVRVEASGKGRILTEPSYGEDGTSILVKIYPDTGYQLKPGTLRYLTGPGQRALIDEVSENFSLPASHVTIKAEFEAIPDTK